VLYRVKEGRNILHTTKQRKANFTGHILCTNCLHRHFIEGNKGRDKRDRKTWKKSEHLVDDLRKKEGTEH